MSEREILYLLPGLLCDQRVWRHQLDHLQDLADMRVMDFRGHESIRSMAAAVLREAPRKFAVAGHSMGGRVALEVANIGRDRVSKLALLDTDVYPRHPGEEQRRRRLLDVAESFGMAELARTWAKPLLHPDHAEFPALMDLVQEMVSGFTLEEYKAQVKALLYRPDATGYLRNISCPVMVLCGRQDQSVSVEQHELIAAYLEDSRFVIIESSGHMTLLERPAAVTEAMRDWLING
jgi:pimeloyl-ACP methyl ester carboxylesterase